MNKAKVAPYGTWKSPISSDLLVSNMVRMGKVCLDGEEVYWLETRPEENGRDMLVCASRGTAPRDVTPLEFNIRTRVHEFGGGSFSAFNGAIYFSNLTDQRIYKQVLNQDGSFSAPLAITPAPQKNIARHLRFADITGDVQRNRLIAVQEDHTITDTNSPGSIVAIALDGTETITSLVSGADFYSSPKVSPDGKTLAWISWNHPNMPWYGTELWTASIASDGTIANKKWWRAASTMRYFSLNGRQITNYISHPTKQVGGIFTV